MRRPLARITVRRLMIAVALVALNLSTAIATSKYFPLPRFTPMGVGNNHYFHLTREDGSAFVIRGAIEGPSVSRQVRPPMPPTWRLWSPIIAGAAITSMVLIVAARIPRNTAARGVMAFLLLALTMVSLHWWRVLDGRDLPLDRLKLGMTRPEVRAIVGPPDPEGSTEDSWLIAHPGSLYWLAIKFNSDGRLDAYPPGSHLGRHHPGYRSDLR